MLNNSLHFALRALRTQKLYSGLNILGLSVGIACSIMIGLFVQHELSYDSQYKESDRIYRISVDIIPGDGSPEIHMAGMSAPVAPRLKLDFPQIEQVSRIRAWEAALSYEDNSFYEDAVMAESNIFEIFDFDWLSGVPGSALTEPSTIVLTESIARKYFGSEDPLGRILTLQGSLPMRVTGIIKDLPDNTHLKFDVLVSMLNSSDVFSGRDLENLSIHRYHTYVLLGDNEEIEDIQRQSADFFERLYGTGASETFGFSVTPLKDIHLHSARSNELGQPGSITVVYAFSLIAIIILLVACVNFVNLTTASSTNRIRGIGTRIILGAERQQLAAQFLLESLVLTFLAMIIAISLVELGLPILNTYIQIDLEFSPISDFPTFSALCGTALLVGLASGIYPAYFLSSISPMRAMTRKVTNGKLTVNLRSMLVIFQFAISIALIIGTVTIFSQMNFISNFELGYNKDQIVILEGSTRDRLGQEWEPLKQKLLSHPQITQVTASDYVPGSEIGTNWFIRYENGGADRRSMPVMLVDYDFLETYHIELLSGRAFSPEYGTDQIVQSTQATPNTTASYILNEVAARQLGWSPDQAIGKWFELNGFGGFPRGPIIGVTDNAYFRSIRNPIEPVVYAIPPNTQRLSQASLRISGNNVPETLEYIDSAWAELIPAQPIRRRFLEEDFSVLYQAEERQGGMLTYFSLLAVFIACLGLFGLAKFSVDRRTKEIGVRKVVGGSFWSIVFLLTSDFNKLVLVSNLIAWPLAYVAMDRWLEIFAYRIELTPLIFIGGGLIAFLIACVTVSGTAAKAANANPVLALRHE